jgi:hypothetical protein
LRTTRGESVDDLFAAPQDIDTDVGVEDALHNGFST